MRSMTGLTVQPSTAGHVAGDAPSLRIAGAAYGQERYELWATLQGSKVTGARCSCPVGGNGRCKHMGALLARAAGDAAAFAVLPALSEVLGALDETALRDLIAALVDAEPQLLAFVIARSARPPTAEAPTAELGAVRMAVEAAFAAIQRMFDPYEDQEEGPDDRALWEAMHGADRLLRQSASLTPSQAAWALEVYIAVLDGVEETYSNMDLDWGLDDVQAHAFRAVQQLVRGGHLSDHARADAIETILSEIASDRGHLHEIQQLHAFVEALDAGERQVLLTLLRDLMTRAAHDFQRSRYARALAELTANDNNVSDKERETLLRASADIPALADFLLKRGQLQAVRDALQNPQLRVHLPSLSPTFAAHDQLPLLEDLMSQNLEVAGIREWLFERYVQTQRRTGAHALALAAVKGRPSAFWLAALKSVSADWNSERPDIIARIWKSGQYTSTLMAFLLSEELIQDAIQLTAERQDVPAQQLVLLADALAKEGQTQWAAALIERAAQQGIDRKNRGGYQEAAEILGRLKGLLGAAESRAQVREIMNRHPRLSSFRKALEEAGLL